MRTCHHWQFETMAATECLCITEQWIRDKLNLQHKCLADVRSLCLPGTYETGKIGHLGISLKNFVRIKSLDLSYNALVSVEGILHLKLLEKLNLYYNRISSLQDILALGHLQNLRELDLRLNPVVKKDPYYRLYLVHAINKLRKLDDCPVRDRERKAALMHFSVESDVEPSQKTPSIKEETKHRSSGPRIASVNRMMMSKLTLREGNEETVLNHRFEENRNAVTQEEWDRQEGARPPGTQHPVGERPSADAPKVTFADLPSAQLLEKASEDLKQSRTAAEINFTPHPGYKNTAIKDEQSAWSLKNHAERKRNSALRSSSLTFQLPDDEENTPERDAGVCKEAHSKPMELLLSLVDEYWSGNRNHTTKHFFTHAVRILCMMEQEVSDRETEMKLPRQKIQKLNGLLIKQEEQHQSEIQNVTEKLQQANGKIEHLDEELRSVLEENVSLQKQLIRLQQQILSDKLKEMPEHTGPR
ncbi:centrosomal protein of 72 kDa [Trichomycterus rosablanca]|uniref:centrosomal protein of 72 kDa n=1 Tax=Trichomycterus rosablanca TaxID=2290929 RepID=UPI002F35B75A